MVLGMTNISSATVRFQTDRTAIETELAAIQSAWSAQGIATKVMDEHGEIDPDAELELLDRLPAMRNLMDSEDGTFISVATHAQIVASDEAGETGVFLIDADGDVIGEQDENQPWVPQPVRRVYVEA
jgi:hypothetical protein